MYELESALYKRRVELKGSLLSQFSKDNKVVFSLWAITTVVMEVAHLGWRDWISGHFMMLVFICGYLFAQTWIGRRV